MVHCHRATAVHKPRFRLPRDPALRGPAVTAADAGSLAYREFGDAPGPLAPALGVLATRSGKDGHHSGGWNAVDISGHRFCVRPRSTFRTSVQSKRLTGFPLGLIAPKPAAHLLLAMGWGAPRALVAEARNGHASLRRTGHLRNVD
jgi:hypothetical protein